MTICSISKLVETQVCARACLRARGAIENDVHSANSCRASALNLTMLLDVGVKGSRANVNDH